MTTEETKLPTEETKLPTEETKSPSEETESPSEETASPSAIYKIIDLVKYPIITQKTYIALFKNRQYTFDVDIQLTKPQIKKVFETLFSVNVIAVNTHIPPRQKIRVGLAQGFRPQYKRAIITLKEGQFIDYSIKKAD